MASSFPILRQDSTDSRVCRNGAIIRACGSDPTGNNNHTAVDQIMEFLKGGHNQDILVFDPVVQSY